MFRSRQALTTAKVESFAYSGMPGHDLFLIPPLLLLIPDLFPHLVKSRLEFEELPFKMNPLL